VVAQATVTDTAGNAVDLDELLGRKPADAAAEDEAEDNDVIEGEMVENDQHS